MPKSNKKLVAVVFVTKTNRVCSGSVYHSYAYDRYDFEQDDAFSLENCRKKFKESKWPSEELVKEIKLYE